MRVALCATALLVYLPDACSADICSTVRTVITEAPDHFRNLTKENSFDAKFGEYVASLTMDGASYCTINDSRDSFSCSWEFNQDEMDRATKFSDSLREQLAPCLPAGTAAKDRSSAQRQSRSTAFEDARDNLKITVSRWLWTSKRTRVQKWMVDVTVERN